MGYMRAKPCRPNVSTARFVAAALAVAPVLDGCIPASGTPASGQESVCEAAARHHEACTGEYITPPVCDDAAAEAAERILAADCEHLDDAVPGQGDADAIAGANRPLPSGCESSDETFRGSSGDGASCTWFGTGCAPDEPIFEGAPCRSDADCRGDRFCVEEHCFAGVTSEEFADVLDEYTGSREIAGNRTDLLVDNVRTRRVWYKLVESAHRSVHLAMHGIKDDAQGDELVERLIDASKRGVEVRVLVDAFTQYRIKNYKSLQKLARAGVPVLSFNPPVRWAHLRGSMCGFTMNNRLHEKMIVVDGKDAIVSGRNVGSAYMTPDRWRDVGVHLHGPAVAEVQRIFLDAWERTAAWEREAGCPNRARYELYCPSSDPSLAEDPDYYPDPEPSGDGRARAIYSAPFLQEIPNGYFTTLALVRGARESITIANAYLIPPRRLRRHLRAAADRGVDITMITNSKKTNNFPSTYYAGLNYYRELIQAGIDIYEYEGAETLHAKTMLVDGELAVVGSYNLDPRSAVDNSEAMVLLQDARAVDQLQHALHTMRKNSRQASADISLTERIKARAHRIVEPWL